jgi:methyl-accepting chemotaxis protein
MPKRIASPAALADWLDMLENIDNSVSRALAEFDKRQPAEPVPPADAPPPSFNSQIDGAFRGLEERLAAARELAAEIEVMLETDEQVVRGWRQMAEAARERLAVASRL